jgi:lysophospholipase L1-like esterase
MSKRIEELDSNMRSQQAGDGMVWRNLRELTIEGRGWEQTRCFYDRLPAKAQGVVREPVWTLSQNSAGIAARFVTDAPTISARWRLRCETLAMPHMPASGVSGLDLYARHQGGWRWMGASRDAAYPTSSSTLTRDLASERRECMLYLPLYNGVEEVEIGVPSGSMLEPARPGDRSRPICFYGTSIVQGGCASRPGMVHTAILGRRLDRATINLGFSGNGCMESEVADLLSELDPAIYVIDCLPNMRAEDVESRVNYLARRLRENHPDTPLVFVDNLIYTQSPFCGAEGGYGGYKLRNEAQRRAVKRLGEDGMVGLHYVPCDDLIGSDGEATVDGTHLTDLGYYRFADALEPVLRKLL